MPPDAADEALVPFHEFVALAATEREGRTPYINVVRQDRSLGRLQVSVEIVRLAEERLQFWSQLRQLAGLEIAPSVRDAVVGDVGAQLAVREAALRAEYDTKLAQLKAEYPAQIARRLAEGLLRRAGSSAAVADLLASMPVAAGARLPARAPANTGSASPRQPAPNIAAPAVPVVAGVAEEVADPSLEPVAAITTAVAVADDDEAVVLEAYIESARCTTCNECTNLSKKIFAYNADKQAYVKDAAAGTFQQLVLAAERCPVSIIHPGTPLNPKEKDVERWLKRATKFN